MIFYPDGRIIPSVNNIPLSLQNLVCFLRPHKIHGAFFMWISWMIVSRCCHSDMYIVHDYYVCERCHFACDTIVLNNYHKEDEDAEV